MVEGLDLIEATIMKTEIDLRDARSVAADGVIEDIDVAEFHYLGRTGWEDDGPDRLICKAFLEKPEGSDDPSYDMAIGINFVEGTAEVLSVEYELPQSEPESCFEM